ncbi:MAG: DNA-binding protein WhiA [Bacilli bacterium]
MSFTRDVKNEISKHNIENISKIAELSAIISNSYINDNKIRISTENASVSRYVFNLIKDVFNMISKITVRNGYNYHKNYIYILEISRNIFEIVDKVGISSNLLPYSFIIDDEDSKRSYIRGVFMMTGSVNDPKKSRYHLEFLFETKEYASFFSNLINEYDLGSKIFRRETKYMVYVKEAEKIGDFLRIISATEALLYYEDIRIYRDHKNMTNRLNNCEQANVDKIIETGFNQVKYIELIMSADGFDFLDEKIKEVALYRLKYQDVSLQELSEIISLETGKLLTKSGLNHRFKKIKEIAQRIEKSNL